MKKFSFPKMQNRQLIFSPKIPYDLVADLPRRQAGRSEANLQNLQFPVMWRCGESNPGLRNANAPLYHLTTSPWKSGGTNSSILPLDHRPAIIVCLDG